MLVFGILLLIILGGIALIIWGDFGGYDGKEAADATGFGIILIASIVSIILLCELPWKKSVEYDIAKYNNLKTEVLQTANCPIMQKELVEEVDDMNNYIDKNRIYKTSLWKGWFYSEKIGNLEKIQLKP